MIGKAGDKGRAREAGCPRKSLQRPVLRRIGVQGLQCARQGGVKDRGEPTLGLRGLELTAQEFKEGHLGQPFQDRAAAGLGLINLGHDLGNGAREPVAHPGSADMDEFGQGGAERCEAGRLALDIAAEDADLPTLGGIVHDRRGLPGLGGKIAAGVPKEAIENEIGRIASPGDLAANAEHFALEVKGDSMINAGILEGDVVILRKCDTANTGDIIVGNTTYVVNATGGGTASAPKFLSR